MAFAMLHSFNDKQIFKISYTNSAVEIYEARSKEEWESKFDNWAREWAIEFPNADLAKRFKMAKAKGMKRTRGLGLSNDYLSEYVAPEGYEELAKTYVSCFRAIIGVRHKNYGEDLCGLFNFVLTSEEPKDEPRTKIIWTRVFKTLEDAKEFLEQAQELYKDKAVKIGDVTIYLDSKKPDHDAIVQALADLEGEKDKQRQLEDEYNDPEERRNSRHEDDPEAYARDYGEGGGGY